MLLDYILKDGNRDLAAFTEKLTDYLKKYFVIGGMPSAILKWLDTHDFFEVDDVQKQLVAAYENDFSKHTPKTNDRENKICVGQHTLLDDKRIRDASIYTLKKYRSSFVNIQPLAISYRPQRYSAHYSG